MKILAARLAFFTILLSTLSAASASPYIGTDLAFDINGHRWGFWSLLDSPSHDYTSDAFQQTNWMGSDLETTASSDLRNYWVIGVGPIGAIYLTRGVAIFCTVLLILFGLYIKAKCSGEQGVAPNP